MSRGSRLRLQLGGAVGVLVAVAVAVAAVGSFEVWSVRCAYDGAVAEAVDEERAALAIAGVMNGRRMALRAHVASGGEQFLGNLREARRVSREGL